MLCEFLHLRYSWLDEGAADGAGLWNSVSEHLERCRVLLHMIDLYAADGSDLHL